ncbi:MAG: hypothetical protein H0X37_08325 [Herpetosiphonaceae bacterium]|nr:hypothetical protein [Herpetosiphonaceae bacterium]
MSTTWQGADLDEMAPNNFIVRNERVRPFLRGEGTLSGSHFLLETWRRDGLIARIRSAGLSVRTLLDRVNALPTVPSERTVGPQVFRPLGTAKEQWAGFDRARLRWRDLPIVTHEGRRGVEVLVDEPVRRRKSRSGGDFFVIVPQGTGGAGLLAVDEEAALLQAYALLGNSHELARLHFTKVDDHYHVQGDGVILPPRHAETLDLLSAGKTRWTFGPTTSALAERVFEKLAIVLFPGIPLATDTPTKGA